VAKWTIYPFRALIAQKESTLSLALLIRCKSCRCCTLRVFVNVKIDTLCSTGAGWIVFTNLFWLEGLRHLINYNLHIL